MNIEKLVEILELLLIEESYSLGVKLMEEEASKVKDIKELSFKFDCFDFDFKWKHAHWVSKSVRYVSLANLMSDGYLYSDSIEFYPRLSNEEKFFINKILDRWKSTCLK